jgi:hypothetical protein
MALKASLIAPGGQLCGHEKPRKNSANVAGILPRPSRRQGTRRHFPHRPEIDIWAGAPGFPGAPPHEAAWAIVTGPDMRFRRRNWEPLRDRLEQGYPVLAAPLEIWRTLVALIGAPPSAGLLMLAWLKEILGTLEGVTAVGIGSSPSGGSPYRSPAEARRSSSLGGRERSTATVVRRGSAHQRFSLS